MKQSTQDLTPARLWRRLAAVVYDLLIVAALLMCCTIAVILLRGGRAIDPGSLWFQLLLLAVAWLYFCWSWSAGGQTVGMRAWRLVLLPREGKEIGFGQASLRFVTAALSTAALGAGFVWCLVDSGRLCWHDRLSRTRLCFRAPSAKPGDREHGDHQ